MKTLNVLNQITKEIEDLRIDMSECSVYKPRIEIRPLVRSD
jgi:hypothetical protein